MKTFDNPWKNYTPNEKTTDRTDKSPPSEKVTDPFVGSVGAKVQERDDFEQASTVSLEVSKNYHVIDKHDELLARAEALITLYGPLKVDSGMNGCALNITRPETLVQLYYRWPWGIISTANGVSVMKWGEIPM